MNTEKLYYTDPYLRTFEGTVLSCEQTKKGWNIVLDRTAFYPEGGGQPADTGTLGNARVLDVHEKDGEILHMCDSPLSEGDSVHGEIDWERRFDHMQQHSGEHIVSGMICSAFGCSNVGFHMGADTILIDYDAYMMDEDVRAIEDKANGYIWEDHDIDIRWPDAEELCTIDYRSKKELTGDVRIVSFPGADCCACCGTHVTSSGQVGLVKFISRQKFHDGVRLELLCGKRALDFLSGNRDMNQEIGRLTSSKWSETADAVSRLMEELEDQKQRADRNEDLCFELLAERYKEKGDVSLIYSPLSSDGVRRLCDHIHKVCGGSCMVFAGEDGAYKYAVMDDDEDSLRTRVKDVNSSLNGRGGGRGGLAQGSIACSAIELENYLGR